MRKFATTFSSEICTEQCLLRLILDYHLSPTNYLELYRLLTNVIVRETVSVCVDSVEDFLIVDVGNGRPLIIYEYTSARGKRDKYSRNIRLPELAYINQRYREVIKLRESDFTPHVTILYSGDDYRPSYEIVDLSEYYNPSRRISPDWVVKIINLNRGFNDELLSTFKPLNDYMYIIDRMKNYLNIGNPVSVAARKTLEDCQNNHVLRELVGGHHLFVYGILLLEFKNER